MVAIRKDERKRVEFRLDMASGVPVYRQIIDQVTRGLAAGAHLDGDQLPTVRQLAVDLGINPNTVIRAYRELELRGILETHQGTGTFIRHKKAKRSDAERQRHLEQFVQDLAARTGAAGFTVEEVLEQLSELYSDSNEKRR